MQLVVPQLLQELPVPAIGVLNPDSFLEKEAQVEIIRSAFLWHWGQEASLLDSLNERNNSNFKPQSEQTYSYIGIFLLLITSLGLLGAVSQAGGTESVLVALPLLFGNPFPSKSLRGVRSVKYLKPFDRIAVG